VSRFRVSEIYRSIQGEGKHTGSPCTIVRLQGCNLRCSFCDTPHALDAMGGKEYTIEQLMDEVQQIHIRGNIILLTGGEPAMQDLTALLALSCLGPLHIETNGTLPIPSGFSWVVISPKDQPVIKEAMKRANEIKWLVGEMLDVDELKEFLARWQYIGAVSVQPLSLSETATKTAYNAVLANGWNLSLQTHKLIGVQ